MKSNEESVFTEALAKGNPRERASFLDQACAGDPALRASVESLLAAYEAGGFLETPVVERPGTEVKDQAPGSSTQAYPSIDTNESASLEFLTPSAKPELLGRLGHYEILEVIGRGGMGIVLRAFDEKLHRVVAIKVMAAQLATSATARRRFTREAQAQAAVSHDHIVTIHAVEEANGLPYLVMQYIAGMSLQDRLEKSGPLQLHEILRIGMQTAAGLAAAHAQGLVHRDIKPANILLENGVERVKVTDFGLARAATEANLTQSGVVAGTPQYMSPEQAEGKAIDQRTDLFSLGSVLYAMCSGRAPFRATGAMAVLKRVCEETPTPIRETNSEIPDWLVAIIDKLHAKEPAQRFQSAAEVAELLARHLAQVQHPSLSPRSLAQPRRRLVLAAAVLLCFVAGLSLTEAAGVTHLRATLARIFTPEGMPVVKTDPDVKVENGAFVLLAGEKERKFDTLAEAVQNANAGDTIEIRGNGPFVTEPVSISRSINIRAAAGFRPQLQMASSRDGKPLLNSVATWLTLEGLEFVYVHREPVSPEKQIEFVQAAGDELHVVNCRFVRDVEAPGPCLRVRAAKRAEIRNSEFIRLRMGNGIAYHCPGQGTLLVENCVDAGYRLFLQLVADFKSGGRSSILLRRNTSAAKETVQIFHDNLPQTPPPADALLEPRLSVKCVRNVFQSREDLLIFGPSKQRRPDLTLEKLAAHCRASCFWQEEGSLYSNAGFLGVIDEAINLTRPQRVAASLEDWSRFWGHDSSMALAGAPVFHGGDIYGLAQLGDARLASQDFRLRPDSPGYRAGPDGKDLGADVDLVGPGPAYERSKKTPEYQQWLKETEQLRAEAPKPEPGAFVLLAAGKEKKFDTLTEAVQFSGDGDTIEIRGNGPFVSDGVPVRHSLAIRAGTGYAPAITLNKVIPAKKGPHQVTNQGGVLVLEGLQLEGRYILFSAGAPGALHVANCRLILKTEGPGRSLFASNSQSLFVRNSILSTNFENNAMWGFTSGGRCNIDNCVLAIGGFKFSTNVPDVTDVSLSIRGNTFVGNGLTLHVLSKPNLPADGRADPPLRLELSGNVARWDGTARGFLYFHQYKFNEPQSTDQAEALLPRLVHLDEKQNVYRTGTPMLSLAVFTQPLKGKRAQDLADWDRFWDQKNTGSVEGDVRFQGGDLSLRAWSGPEHLTAEDFRLRPDSAGYRAGKDKKDLGADVDLVGTGPAYERWKKTPDYQQWLMDTGQVKK